VQLNKKKKKIETSIIEKEELAYIQSSMDERSFDSLFNLP
jgi:hypothetical protein